MAYIKVGTTASANRAISYVQKDDRAAEIGGNTLDPTNVQSVKQEMQAVRIQWQKDDKVQAHIVYQSFKGRECDPQTANKIGCDLAEKIAPGHQYHVVTHTDSVGGNTHNHIIINSVNIENGHKLESAYKLQDSRDISDQLCREHGLSIAREPAKLRYTIAEQGLQERGVQSWKDEIREVIDDAKKVCKNPEEFKQELGKYGVTMTERGKECKITYQHPNGMKVRAAKLGTDYERQSIEKALQVVQTRSVESKREIPKDLEGVELEKRRRLDAITKPEIALAQKKEEAQKAAERLKYKELAKIQEQQKQEQQKVKKVLRIESPQHNHDRGGMGR